MLAVFAVVLALAGAPATTPMGCYPTITNDPGDALTLEGLTIYGDPTRVELRESICEGLVYAAANRQGRAEIARRHRGQSINGILAVGLLVALHEAEHVALGPTASECTVETAAFRKLPVLARRFAPRQRQTVMAYARGFHQALPASYRYC